MDGFIADWKISPLHWSPWPSVALQTCVSVGLQREAELFGNRICNLAALRRSSRSVKSVNTLQYVLLRKLH